MSTISNQSSTQVEGKQKLKNGIPQALDIMCQGFYNRNKEISAMLLSVLAGYNSVFIGRPGVAKSAIANRILSALPKPGFTLQFSAYTEIEELFGPLNLTSFRENDRRIRMTHGYLPSARYAVLDEIFKAQSSTLNALLLILNERRYVEEGESKPTSLEAVIASSNERPDEEATALADRMCMYINVKPTSDNELKDFMTSILSNPNGTKPLDNPIITMSMIAKINKQIDDTIKLNMSKIIEIIQAFNSSIKQLLNNEALYREAKLSDRAMYQCARLLATSCVMREDNRVLDTDAWFFEYMARSESYIDTYQAASAEVCQLYSSLGLLKESLMSKGEASIRRNIVKVQECFDRLPHHWRSELNSLINAQLANMT